MRITMTAGALALLLAACADTTPEPEPEPLTTDETTREEATPPMADPGTITYAPELNVEVSGMQQTDTGLYYEVLSEGSGVVVAPGQTAVVHYTGWLPDGTKFDSSRDRGGPLSFPVGAGRVIAGWDEGVAGMAVGEERKLVIPPDLGYGARGSGGVIPPNAVLVFDVELLEIR
jgi:FKBP-type peptidyl-prolyl cis-trans isomerase